jgi:hypothetical protein
MLLKDITGQTFGKWTVVERAGKDSRGNACWLCRCTCGDMHVVRGDDLRNEGSRGCVNCAGRNRFAEGRPRKGNRFEIFGDSIAIWLDPSAVCFIDAADHALVNGYTWCAKISNRKGTIRTYAVASNGVISMHGLIMGTPPVGKTVDHEDRNGLNNRRLNLRFVTPTQSVQNRDANYNKRTSQYKGVRKYKQNGRFEARIQVNGRRIHLGSFESEEDAAEAYNEAAQKYFGEFAVLNELKKDELILNQ